LFFFFFTACAARAAWPRPTWCAAGVSRHRRWDSFILIHIHTSSIFFVDFDHERVAEAAAGLALELEPASHGREKKVEIYNAVPVVALALV
jgi:hypothetical protein